jgi:hypothetical protein
MLSALLVVVSLFPPPHEAKETVIAAIASNLFIVPLF